MATPRWRVEMQHRYTAVETDLPYYWTNVYTFDTPGTDHTFALTYNAILEANYQGTLEGVELVAVRISRLESPFDVSIATPLDNNGFLPEGGGGSLTNTVLLRGMLDGRQVCYKRWRMPMREEDIEGFNLSADCLTLFNDVIIPQLDSCVLCNAAGDAPDHWEVDRRVHSWQLRHGTKRRARVVFAYP